MKKVVIIGACCFQNPIILKAKEMGFETHVFAWREGSIGEKTADHFYPISVVDREQILEKCREIQPEAVVTIASDVAAVTAGYVASRLGLVANSPECIYRTTNKYAMRMAMKEHGVRVPAFWLMDEHSDPALAQTMPYPLIVKPTDRSGSRSITKVTRPEELMSAVRRAVADSFEHRAIAEEFIDGDEYSMESVSYRGEHHFLALTKKYTTGAPAFIETGHLQPSGLSEEARAYVEGEVFKVLDALEIEYGASHSEFRLDRDGNLHMIEVGARMGGDCIGSDLVRLSTGYDFVAMTLEVGLGRQPSFQKVCEPKVACVRFVMNAADLAAYHDLKRRYPEHFVVESEMEDPGDHAVIDSSTRFGYYVATWDTPEEAEAFLAYRA